MFIVDLTDIDRIDPSLVGGKAANLGELSGVDGISVPAGMCVTTEAFGRGMTVEVAAAVTEAVDRLGGPLFAVRSSATAEDAPSTSFAGQYDTFLDVEAEAVVEHVQRCWDSLGSDRAVAYRRRHGIGAVAMGVVVQQMVPAEISGVLFTADPATGHRGVTAVEAVAGRGDALLSGHITPEAYRVRDGEFLAREGELLTTAQVWALERVGRRIEAHFGAPQDIEWCIARDVIRVVQSRPITTLFPVPQAREPGFRVYLSMGHQQMMTDAMTALGRSMWQMTTPVAMVDAGARLFADATPRVSTPGFLEGIGRTDPLMREALHTVLGPDGSTAPTPPTAAPDDVAPTVVGALIAENERSVATLHSTIRGLHGPALFAFIREDVQELRRLLFQPESHAVIMAAHHATWWLNEHLEKWLDETNVADVLSRSAPGNVTSQMGLALLEVADAIRPHPELVARLRDTGDPSEIDAVDGFLDTYGVRCPGEIDLGRPRWREDPTALAPIILADIEHAAPDEARRRFARGQQEAQDKEHDLLRRLRQQPEGEARAAETARVIAVLRATVGYREYPKFGMIRRYAVYRDALLTEATRLGVATAQDVVHLHFDELEDASRSGTIDGDLIERRRRELAAAQGLTPPRVLTSDGEAITGAYRPGDAPPGVLAGLPVSAGIVEGRARVVHDPTELEPGDILITTFTDPSWSPTFLTVSGLVTEVGGLMTHGAVVAREYGLPALVGVADATRLIPDRAPVRLDADHGWVVLL